VERSIGIDANTAIYHGIVWAAGASISKEWYDEANGGVFSWEDIKTDAYGIAFGTTINYIAKDWIIIPAVSYRRIGFSMRF
jgi:uncharacterized protein YfiM (DUF2279 family)